MSRGGKRPIRRSGGIHKKKRAGQMRLSLGGGGLALPPPSTTPSPFVIPGEKKKKRKKRKKSAPVARPAPKKVAAASGTRAEKRQARAPATQAAQKKRRTGGPVRMIHAPPPLPRPAPREKDPESLSDAHITSETQLFGVQYSSERLARYLDNFPPSASLKTSRFGQLLHGPTGTGKSCLARLALEKRGYQIVRVDNLLEDMTSKRATSFTEALKRVLRMRKSGGLTASATLAKKRRVALLLELDDLLEPSQLNALATFMNSDAFRKAQVPAVCVAAANFRRGGGRAEFKRVVRLCDVVKMSRPTVKAAALFLRRLRVTVRVPAARRGAYGNLERVTLGCPSKEVERLVHMSRRDMRVLQSYAREMVVSQVQGRSFCVSRTDSRASVFDAARDLLRKPFKMFQVAALLRDAGCREQLFDLVVANYPHEVADETEDKTGRRVARAMVDSEGDAAAVEEEFGEQRLRKWAKKHQGLPATIDACVDVAESLSAWDTMDRTAASEEGDLIAAATVNGLTHTPASKYLPEGTARPPHGCLWSHKDRRTGALERLWNRRNPNYNERVKMNDYRVYGASVGRQRTQCAALATKLGLGTGIGANYMEVRYTLSSLVDVHLRNPRVLMKLAESRDLGDADLETLTSIQSFGARCRQ